MRRRREEERRRGGFESRAETVVVRWVQVYRATILRLKQSTTPMPLKYQLKQLQEIHMTLGCIHAVSTGSILSTFATTLGYPRTIAAQTVSLFVGISVIETHLEICFVRADSVKSLL